MHVSPNPWHQQALDENARLKIDLEQTHTRLDAAEAVVRAVRNLKIDQQGWVDWGALAAALANYDAVRLKNEVPAEGLEPPT